MTKKTWLKVKRGLLDPKHQQKMGVRVWLYLYILDIANWETGTVTGWTDKECSDDLGIPKSTVRKQRQKLETDGYITSVREFQSSKIIIHNYTNPRKYDGEVINPKGHTVQEWTPPPVKNYVKIPYTVQHSAHYSVQQSAIEMDTPPLDSQNHNPHIIKEIKDSVLLHAFLLFFGLFDKDKLIDDPIRDLTTGILEEWKFLFPDKPQPRRSTVTPKIKTRSKDPGFLEKWRDAMVKASHSKTCRDESWFDLKFFLGVKDGDINWEKCLRSWMSWKDKQNGNGRANPHPPQPKLSKDELAVYLAGKKAQKERTATHD